VTKDQVLADLGKCDRMLQSIDTIETGLKVAATAEAGPLAGSRKVPAIRPPTTAEDGLYKVVP